MPLDHADYAERRLRRDNEALRIALTRLIEKIEILLCPLEYDDTPSYDQKEIVKEAIRQAKEEL